MFDKKSLDYSPRQYNSALTCRASDSTGNPAALDTEESDIVLGTSLKSKGLEGSAPCRIMFN